MQGGLGWRVLARLRTQACIALEGGGLRSRSGLAGQVVSLVLVLNQLDEGLYRITRAPVMTWLSPLLRDIVDRG